MYAPSFIRFHNTRHAVGDEECEEGYCSGIAEDGQSKYPLPCSRPGCRGLVHAAVNPQDDAELAVRCDSCGLAEMPSMIPAQAPALDNS